MTTTPGRIAIVGASAAGFAVANELRDQGYDGTISLIGAEALPPYDRPPLSKRKAIDIDDIALADLGKLEALDLNLCLGQRAVGLDTIGKTVHMADGRTVRWDACVIATGADPIRIPGVESVLRTMADAHVIQSRLDRAGSVAIIGAGVLGCELASLAISMNCAVTVIDGLPGPMQNRLGTSVSDRLRRHHQEAGVTFRLGQTVSDVAGNPDQGYRIGLSDGGTVQADAVIAAVGCRPATGWLKDSDVPVNNGVLCDENCRAMPDVFAAGDVANWFNPRFGRHMRVEHRMNATEQGMAVANQLLARGRPFDPIPFFWTDQGDLKLQVHGLVGPDMEIVRLDGETDDKRFVLAYLREGLIEGVLGWNMAQMLRKARPLIGRPRAAIADWAK
ncbi:NAD(P)/FAD-dependent oxidoreductase [Pacificispira sp.]|uniref:NAD(P)/FAD-dependent oxidoreductase n=1 Tax=Pacificispira sp. TaxID=2888761 RepID=UPI003B518C6C